MNKDWTTGGTAYMHNFWGFFFVFFAFFFSLVKRRWLCPVIYSVTPVSTENTHEHSETVTGSVLRNAVVIRQNFQCKYHRLAFLPYIWFSEELVRVSKSVVNILSESNFFPLPSKSEVLSDASKHL